MMDCAIMVFIFSTLKDIRPSLWHMEEMFWRKGGKEGNREVP